MRENFGGMGPLGNHHRARVSERVRESGSERERVSERERDA